MMRIMPFAHQKVKVGLCKFTLVHWNESQALGRKNYLPLAITLHIYTTSFRLPWPVITMTGTGNEHGLFPLPEGPTIIMGVQKLGKGLQPGAV